MNIYIGNFAYDISEDDLKAAFSAFGRVAAVKVIKDKFTADSRGFGFVDMPNKTEAEAAMKGITEIKGKRITINEARPQALNYFETLRPGPAAKFSHSRAERRY